MFPDHDETSPSIAAVSACGAATEKALSPIRDFVDVSTAQRGCHTMKRVVQSDLEYWQPMSGGLRYIPACVLETTCDYYIT